MSMDAGHIGPDSWPLTNRLDAIDRSPALCLVKTFDTAVFGALERCFPSPTKITVLRKTSM